ncbi:MAG: hypothetical protein GVY36_13425 [Verrucomicrobia bacterium]|jgi:hypothetical protein|nr:hypothetical protein [Verrucomicrobiota bacterium]
MAGSMDSMAETAHKALLEVEEDPRKKREMEEQFASREGMVGVLKKNRQVLLEIVLVRHVENYLNYLSGVLFEIFRQRPETLRSSEQVALSDVLSHSSLDQFIHAEAEKRVNRLSYSSFGELSDYFLERFSLQLFPEDEKSLVIEAIEIRNISVHNRCIVNERFCNRTGMDPKKIGKRKELFIDTLNQVVPILFAGVRALDKNARRKLKLKGKRFGELNP